MEQQDNIIYKCIQEYTLKEINRNYMKKWSKEEDEKLMKILDESVEQDKIIKYDDEFRMEFGRTGGALISRLKKLIYEEYDEESWEECVKAAAIRDYDWERYVRALAVDKSNKKARELEKIKDLIEKYNSQYDKNLKLTS